MRVYFVRRMNTIYDWNYRVSAFHAGVFHGVSMYYGEADLPPFQWHPPAATNTNRELVHVTRSGRYVPPVFGDKSYELLVSEPVRDLLASVPGIEFTPVVFERLVDVPMPGLGDFSWFDRPLHPEDPEYESKLSPDYDLLNAPDVPEFHESIGNYYSLLAPNIHDIEEQYDDIQECTPDWGSYNGRRPKPHALSEKLLAEKPVIRSLAHVFREDVFKVIAPYLNLDYYGIAVIHIGDEESERKYQEWVKQHLEEVRRILDETPLPQSQMSPGQ